MSTFDGPAARSRVHALIEATQDVETVGVRAELAAILTAAEDHGDDWAATLAGCALVFHDLVQNEDAAQDDKLHAACDAMVHQAEVRRLPGGQAMALSLRATLASAGTERTALLSDAGLAVALVELDDVDAYERCFVWTTLSNVYLTLDLWELAAELNDRADDLAPQCERPELQLAAIRSNRVIIGLAWAAALLEHGDEPAALLRLREAREAAATLEAEAGHSPTLWLREARSTHEVVSFLLACVEAGSTGGDAFADDALARLEGHRTFLAGFTSTETLPYLEGLTALGLLHLGRIEDARSLAAQRRCTTPTAPAQVFSAWIHARASVPSRPDELGPAAQAYRDYAALVSQLRWSARAATLATARARIDDSRLVTEHALLSREVHSDPLTGLSNRRAFDHWLLSDPDHGGPAALVLIDVDDFKQVNDRHGHAVGDEVLRRIAAAVSGCVRDDDIAVRLGGDEFAVILTASGPTETLENVAGERARAIAQAVEATGWDDLADGLRVAVAAGYAAGVVGGLRTGGAQDLYRRADEAMYTAKRLRAHGVRALS